MVAICFDDGAVGSSSDSTSMRIINAIANEGFRATFFYVGNWINSTDKENEVKYAYSKGMEIANHSTSHPDLTTSRQARSAASMIPHSRNSETSSVQNLLRS